MYSLSKVHAGHPLKKLTYLYFVPSISKAIIHNDENPYSSFHIRPNLIL